MKAIIIGILIFSSLCVFAHDEPHGPAVSDTGKYGGLVSAVVLKSDHDLGNKAALLHKSEFVRANDGTTRLYLYDKDMKPLDISKFESKATAVVAAKVKGKWKETTYELERKESAFIGKMAKAPGRPFNVDVTLKAGGRDLLTAFDNLD